VVLHVSIDGVNTPVSEATISVTDDGLLRGDGVFEVTRIYTGRAFALDEHLVRLKHSAETIRLPVDTVAIKADVDKLIGSVGAIDALLRILVTRGGRRIVMIEELPKKPDSVRLSYVTYSPTRVLDGVKSLSYAANMLVTRLARESGYDDGLMVTPHGRILEGPTFALFWSVSDRLYTPPLSERILASITRNKVMELMDVSEKICTDEEIQQADGAFIVSSVREVLAVSAIEGRELTVPNPLADEAQIRLSKYISEALNG